METCLSVEDFRQRAKRRLPKATFDFLDGGADDEVTTAENREAFKNYWLLPRLPKTRTEPSLRTSILGMLADSPLVLSPLGLMRTFHAAAELGPARAASRHGIPFTLSSVGTLSIESVAKANPGPKIFQLYIQRDRAATAAVIERCKLAGFTAICITIDASIGGNRCRDRRNRFRVPLPWKSFLDKSLFYNPGLFYDAVLGKRYSFPNISYSRIEHKSVAEFLAANFETELTWADVEWAASLWNGPFAVKGILSAVDAAQAVVVGARAIVISNHGGRQLDAVMPAIDAVRPIRTCIGGDLELIVDGGVRRGTDVLKAIALGADACAIGRPVGYAVAAGGEAGVDRLLRILREEMLRDLHLVGCSQITELRDSDFVVTRRQ